MNVDGMLLADNLETVGNTSRNCVAQSTIQQDAATNLEDGTTCGWGAAHNPGLSGDLVNAGGDTDVLTIPATSPAKNVGLGPCGQGAITTDQRDADRTSATDSGCDAGAFEEGVAAPPIDDGAQFEPPTATPTPTPPTATPAPKPSPAPTATPAPTPVFHQSVTAKTTGTVTIQKPGGGVEPIDPNKPVPLGSVIDTKNGKITITSVPTAGGKPETATFYDGIFKLTQQGKVTVLTLVEPLAPCSKKKAHSAAKKPKTRRLWGSGKGNFRTTGNYSAATIRGTTWLVTDSCAGTTTKVTKGVVSVKDNVKHKTVLVKARHSYTARPKK